VPLQERLRCLLAGAGRWNSLLLLAASAPNNPLRGGDPVAGVFGVDRMDTWVLKVSIAIPVVAIAGLLLWHMVSSLAGKLVKKRRKFRPALEPRPQLFPAKHLAREPAMAISAPGEAGAPDSERERIQRARELLALAQEDFRNQRFPDCLERCKSLTEAFSDLSEAAEAKQLTAQIKNDPERLQRACASLEDSLAEMYLELADSWSRRGEPRQAAISLRKLVQSCPGTRQAQLARDRLRELGEEA
jgi:hypothetical protein